MSISRLMPYNPSKNLPLDLKQAALVPIRAANPHSTDAVAAKNYKQLARRSTQGNFRSPMLHLKPL